MSVLLGKLDTEDISAWIERISSLILAKLTFCVNYDENNSPPPPPSVIMFCDT